MAECKPLDVGPDSPSQFDDIWALRYVLSHTEDAVALENAKATLAWRREKAELLGAAARGEKLKRFALFERFIVGDYHGRTVSGQPMYIVRAGISNLQAGAYTRPLLGST